MIHVIGYCFMFDKTEDRPTATNTSEPQQQIVSLAVQNEIIIGKLGTAVADENVTLKAMSHKKFFLKTGSVELGFDY